MHLVLPLSQHNKAGVKDLKIVTSWNNSRVSAVRSGNPGTEVSERVEDSSEEDELSGLEYESEFLVMTGLTAPE